ncbi:MAG: type VI secretion system tip protein TssI/VgrG [Polyangiales bacterium]
MTEPLEKVKFSFASQGDPAGAWQVTRLAGHEAVAELYEYAVDLCSEDLHADPDALLGTSSSVTIARGARERLVHGVVRRVERTGVRGLRLTARVFLVPALWAASKRVDSRIFQEKTAEEILRTVLEGALAAFGRTVRFALDRTPAEREYCVQYRESDLDFARRITEEEGIWWYFDHTGEKEELVLVDAPSSLPEAPSLDGPLEVAGPEADLRGAESIRHFEPARELQSTSVVARDFDWTQPTLDLTRASRGTDAQGMDREVYDYPAGLVIGPYDAGAKRYTGDDGTDRARVRREARDARAERCAGESNVVGFTAGTTFELAGHGDASLEGRYFLTRVEIAGEQPEHFYDDAHDAATTVAVDERYRNHFTAFPADRPWRARQNAPRPRVAGSQTATVVGPAGEEIYTDEHGRVKVQFHWDRVGHRDEKSSCFLRVSQAWAGPGWGFVFLPRIGMEVIVTFLEGDPDRPLVTGCVYNGANTPPYTLPDEKTKSTVKSNSSPGGGGYNEIRFEDLAGSEEVFVHAQKDFNEVVEHNHSTLVHNNQSNSIDCNQSESVGGDQSLSVTGNRTKTVEKKETNTVNGERHTTVKPLDQLTVNGRRETVVNGTHTHAVQAGNGGSGDQTVSIGNNRAVDVGVNDTLGVGGNKTDTVVGNYTVNGGPKVQVNQGGTALTFEGGHVELVAASYILLTHGSGAVKIEDSGKIAVGSGTEIELTCGGSTVKVTPSSITLQASEVLLSAGGAVKVDGGGVAITGTKIMSTAGALNMIAGAMVKIN